MSSLLLDYITFLFTRFLRLFMPVVYSFSPLKCLPFFTLLFRNITTCLANSLKYFLEGGYVVFHNTWVQTGTHFSKCAKKCLTRTFLCYPWLASRKRTYIVSTSLYLLLSEVKAAEELTPISVAQALSGDDVPIHHRRPTGLLKRELQIVPREQAIVPRGRCIRT